ncbi:4-alpha-glucanotransferase [Actinomadura rudentiformis]|uniref:4-alpha-glucanotransferase n=1 Tax=Actinomadura rudentiformis TaxID=359158 RepID=A0A6H9Z2J8_9ACTN|nr:4-alpha-glucanotransferase [Actinomadura rudentiformis]KAB2347467.1 4-alpha-glucanotransferase [Actinomadura rudentiformis]
MVDEDLNSLAEAHSVSTRYTDWRGHETAVSRDTLVAVLAALGVDASSPAAVRDELARLRAHERAAPASPAAFALPATAAPPSTPERLAQTPRAWGFTVQLYSVRSGRSWGMGDLRDLADLASWSGGLGAGFVLVNPLHATEPAPPIAPSPYSPMSRRFASPLYLRVEDVPEYAGLPALERERVAHLAALGERGETIDRDAVWAAKQTALELIYRLPGSASRQQAYERFREREGSSLTAFATWCALAEEQGTDWRRWPVELRDADSSAVTMAAQRLADRAGFHTWLQWQLDEQLGHAQEAARAAGMPIGIVHDLAVGVSQGSADAWMYRSLFAHGISVGAPPDEFNQRGQDWGQPPWHPRRLAEAGYAPFREMLAAALRHGGGLRLDHAMQVSRLWWVPEGRSPAEGTYVSYDRNALLACLVAEAARTGAVIIGEDLGTVEPGLREDLARRGILGTSLLWFERDGKGCPRRPERWRELSLATVGTHDMPPITGILHGDHLDLRARLGLLTRELEVEEDEHRRGLADWLDLLHAEGLLQVPPTTIMKALDQGSTEYDEQVVAALHGFLARTPARLLGISLADAVGERRTQNQPGTTDEYPNWRVPLAGAGGDPVHIDDLPGHRGVETAIEPLRDWR